jgi:hypothetical protein
VLVPRNLEGIVIVNYVFRESPRGVLQDYTTSGLREILALPGEFLIKGLESVDGRCV